MLAPFREPWYVVPAAIGIAIPVFWTCGLVIARCEALVAGGEPLIVCGDRTLVGQLRRYKALWLPFSANSSGVAMLPLRDDL